MPIQTFQNTQCVKQVVGGVEGHAAKAVKREGGMEVLWQVDRQALSNNKK